MASVEKLMLWLGYNYQLMVQREPEMVNHTRTWKVEHEDKDDEYFVTVERTFYHEHYHKCYPYMGNILDRLRVRGHRAGWSYEYDNDQDSPTYGKKYARIVFTVKGGPKTIETSVELVEQALTNDAANAPKPTTTDKVEVLKNQHFGRHGAGDWKGLVRHQDKSIVEAWAANLKRNYHPCGYGTTTDIYQEDDFWYCKWSRYGSCD